MSDEWPVVTVSQASLPTWTVDCSCGWSSQSHDAAGATVRGAVHERLHFLSRIEQLETLRDDLLAILERGQRTVDDACAVSRRLHPSPPAREGLIAALASRIREETQ